MKKKFIHISICLLVVAYIDAIAIEKPIGSLSLLSPQTYDFTKYGNLPINHFTGETNVQIPLYTYKDKDFYIPIFLGYNSSGFIPEKREGIVGLNWYLNAGGVITRRINGWPDEKEGTPNSSPAIPHGHYYGVKNNLDVKNKTTADIFNFNCGQVNVSEYWNIASCEVEPDDFNFTMPGHSGRFFIQNNGEVHITGNKAYVVDLSGFALQPANATEIVSSQIVITTDDGYKYYFGGNLQYLEISYSLDKSTQDVIGDPIINAWHLSKIVAPDGRVTIYGYMNFTEGIADHIGPEDNYHYLLNIYKFDHSSYDSKCIDFPLGGCCCSYSSGGGETVIYEATKTVYLAKITIDQSSIEFSYSEKANKFYPGENSPFNQKTMQLNNVYIKYGTETLKTFSLGYENKGGSYGSRHFLISMQELGSNAYSLSYYKTTQIPSPRTIGIDYWGFWNGIYSESGSIMPAINYNQNGDIEYTDSKRDPNTSKCDVGLLEKITYPTGGYTKFYYEGHQYATRLERRNASKFLPALYQVTGYAGGARILKIVDNDGTSDNNIREFKYTKDYPNATNSSGILLDWPRYLFYWEYHNGTQDEYSVRQRSASFNTNYYPGENYIQYAEVTEVGSPSNGYTNYKFTNYETNPDKNDFDTLVIDNNYQQHVTNINLYNSFIGKKFNNLSFERGVAKEVTEYAYQNGTYNPVKKTLVEQFTGLTDYPNHYIVGVLQTGALAQSYKEYYYPYLPKIVKTIRYDENGLPITITNEYTYNNLGFVDQEKTTSSDNKTLLTKYKYPNDFGFISNPAPLQIMKNGNMINYVIEQQDWVNSKLTSATYYKYYNYGNYIPLLNEIHKLETNIPLTNSEFIGLDTYGERRTGTQYKLQMTFNYDNDNLNLILQQKPSDIPTSFIWGYNNSFAVIKADNIDQSTLTSKVTTTVYYSTGYSNLEALLNSITTFPNSAWNTFNQNLRTMASTAMITTYTYKPLVGMTSETDPNGKTTYYFYDSFGRLQYIKDQDLNIIKEYKYHYKE